MASNKGYTNEKLIVEALNNKKYSEINSNLQTFIRDLFSYQDEDCLIKCEQIDGVYKPDIAITYKGITYNVSIKSGRADMLHGENIKTFIPFLRRMGVSEETLKTIVLFHYGDGTYDGSGPKRETSYNAYMMYRNRIKKANEELNKEEDFIDKVLERIMYQGVDPHAPGVDFLYFGTPEYGVAVSKKQIATYIRKRNWKFLNNLHIGPIFIKPHARYANTSIKSQTLRDKVHCYWPHLCEDLDRISKRYTF